MACFCFTVYNGNKNVKRSDASIYLSHVYIIYVMYHVFFTFSSPRSFFLQYISASFRQSATIAHQQHGESFSTHVLD